ncbi:hypothetical protein ACTFIR_012459 [Dictyostelium discoideum]
MTYTKLKEGDVSPNFNAPDQNGIRLTLDDSKFQNKTIIIFFYPKNESKSGANMAREFRDNYQILKTLQCEVIGVNYDDHQKNQQFAQFNDIPFSMLSDTDGAIARRYGVHKDLLVFPSKTTFVINKEHRIDTIYSNPIKVESHLKQALKAVEKMKNSPQNSTNHTVASNTTTNPAVSNPIS